MIAIVCPGQGSQTPGFLSPWLELPGLRERAGALSDAAGVDLVMHGTTSDADTIRDTAVAQPLIVGAGLLALEALYADRPDALASSVWVVAGHSVGEITAAAATGVLTAQDAMNLVRPGGQTLWVAGHMVSRYCDTDDHRYCRRSGERPEPGPRRLRSAVRWRLY